MAPARPYWKGYLKLSLVSCPIALYTGTSSTERVSFRQINKKTGNRLRQQLVDEVTREPVEGENKGRGYEYAKNAYIPVDDDELDAIAIESTHTIEIDSFVPREQIDERYLDSPYYIKPNDQVGQEAFAVIREAMRGKGMVALGRVVLAKRERVIMLEPWDNGLMGTTLRYPYEIRDAKEYFDDIPEREGRAGNAQAGRAHPAKQGGRLRSLAVRGSLRGSRRRNAQEETGRPAGIARACSAPTAEFYEPHGRAPPQHCPGKAASAPPKKGRKRIEGQGEMLLPIQGKKGKQATAKPAERASARLEHAG